MAELQASLSTRKDGKFNETALAELISWLSGRKYALAFFLDVQKTFDRPSFSGIDRTLRHGSARPIPAEWSLTQLEPTTGKRGAC